MHRSRAALVCLPVLFAISGCVTVAPATTPPTTPPTAAASPSPEVTPTSSPVPVTPAPTEAPSPSPVPTATEAPTEAPTAAPTIAPSEAPTLSPSGPPVSPDSSLVFYDTFDEDANGWGVVEAGFGRIEWFDGALAFSAEALEGSLQSTKPVPGGEAWEELGGSGEFTPVQGTDSIMGFYCSPGDGSLIGALVSVDGTWLIVAGTQQAVTVVDQGEMPVGLVAVGETATIAFQCSGAEAELPALMRLAVNGEILATTEIPVGLASMPTFSAMGLWVEPVTPPMLVGVDEVQVVGRHVPRRETNAPPPTSTP